MLWERIRDLLPGKVGGVGARARDNRLFVEAVLYRYRTGTPWRDLSECVGDWKNTNRAVQSLGQERGLAETVRASCRWCRQSMRQVKVEPLAAAVAARYKNPCAGRGARQTLEVPSHTGTGA